MYYLILQNVILFYHLILWFVAKTFTEFCSKTEINNTQFNNIFPNIFPNIAQINNPMGNNNNLFYQFQINELNKQLNEERNRNFFLNNENTRLNNMITDLRNQIINLNNQIGNNQNYENRIESLEREIREKNDEIQKYKSDNEFLNNQLGNSITIIKPGENILAVRFICKKIQAIDNYCLPCKNVNLFVRLEEKLNSNFPQLKEYETYFEVNGRRIKRFKTLDENNIQNNDIVNIFIIDE